MNPDEFLLFLNQYGLLFLFGIVLLEYMNLPGFPAGVIFPAAGAWVQTTGTSFMLAVAVSVVAALLGSYAVYIVGKKGGAPVLEKMRRKRPRIAARIDVYNEKLRVHANSTLLVAKLLPVVRTLIGLPAGAAGIDLKNYMFFSAIGITIWNSSLMLLGVFFGDLLLTP